MPTHDAPVRTLDSQNPRRFLPRLHNQLARYFQAAVEPSRRSTRLAAVKSGKMHLNQPTDSRMIDFPVFGSIIPRFEEISKFLSTRSCEKKEGQGKSFRWPFNNTYGGCGVATIGSDCFATSLPLTQSACQTRLAGNFKQIKGFWTYVATIPSLSMLVFGTSSVQSRAYQPRFVGRLLGMFSLAQIILPWASEGFVPASLRLNQRRGLIKEEV